MQRTGQPLLLSTILLLLGSACLLPAQDPGAQRVLVIGIDGVRPDALAVAQTPNLDRLVRAGAFADTTQILGTRYSKSNTISGPGWSSILTGVWADKHGVHDNEFKGKNYKQFPHFFQRLKDHGIDQKTIVFFTSDNGPHREGGNNSDFNDSNGPLKGVKRDLTDGGIRVPLIVRWPGRVEAGSSSDFVGAFWDVMPTLAELAGTGKHVPEDIDGISFLPSLLGQGTQHQHEFLYWAFYERGGSRALRSGDWKAVQQPIHTPVRLYNLKEDLGEQKDVADDNAELVKKFTAAMNGAYAPSNRWKFPEKKK